MNTPLTIQKAATALRAGEVSSVELARAALERVAAFNDQVSAYLEVTAEAAMHAAAEADAAFSAGIDRSPLQGIPLGLKDILATVDAPTTANSLVLDPAWGEGYDATVTERLRTAGAVLTGKHACAEFAVGTPDPEKPFPIPRNPWNLERTPGGSSSGTAVAIATGMVLGGLGTDTGGSVRIPAAYCGHTGLKVTFGRVPKWGCVPLAHSLDTIGPMARSAWDCAAILGAVAGYDERDPSSATARVEDYLAGLDQPLTGLRIGVPVQYFFDHAALDNEQKTSTEAVIATLRDLGAEVIEVTLPRVAEARGAYLLTLLGEAFAHHRPGLTDRWDDYGRPTRLLVALGALFSAADYVQAQRFRAWFTAQAAEVMAAVDVLVTPMIVSPASPAGDADLVRRLDQPSYSSPINLLGYPALAIPSGFSHDGLPLSTQIVGAPFAEALVLRVGHAYQQVTDYHLRVPPIAAGAVPAD